MEKENKKILKRMINLCYLFAALNLILAFSKGYFTVDVDYTKFMSVTGFFIGYIGIHLSIILKCEGGMTDVPVTTKEKFMKYFGLLVVLSFIGFILWISWRIGVFNILMSK